MDDMDSEYQRFMSELDAQPATPSEAAPAAVQPPAGLPPPLCRPPGTPPPVAATSAAFPTAAVASHSNAHPSALAPPSGPPPPLHSPHTTRAPPTASAPLVPPAGRPPALASRPAGPPPPITAAATMSAPPTGPPPPLATASAPVTTRPIGMPPPLASRPAGAPPSLAGAQPAAPGISYVEQQRAAAAQFNPLAFDPQALQAEILSEKKDGTKKKKRPKEGVLRVAGGETWIDDKLDIWPENDFRIFVGNLGPEVNEDILTKAFQPFPSYTKCRIIQDYKKCKTKAFGFVSFSDHSEGAKVLKAMNGKYIGNRPCQLKKSTHTVRNAPGDNKKRRAMLSNPLERVTTKRMR